MLLPVPTHLIGTPAFFPTLLQHIRTAAPNSASLPLDTALLQSILLCLIAGDKHLILCTPEEDITLVVKLAVWTLQLFSLRTSKLKIRPGRAPSSAAQISRTTEPFLRSLFFPSHGGGESSQDESRHGHGHGHSREGSWTSRKRKSTLKRKSGDKEHDVFHNHGPGHRHRVESYPKTHVPGTGTVGLGLGMGMGTAASAPDALGEHAETGYPFPPTPESARVRLHHANTDPFPMPFRFSKKEGKEKESLREKEKELPPQALVISGLENASLSSQRALSGVLAEGRVVFDEEGSGEEGEGMKLPEGFLLVYVCRWDPRERVGIEKTLLDKFTLSTPIFVSQNIRQAVRSPASPSLVGGGIAHPRPRRAYTYSPSNPSSPSSPHSHLPSHTPPLPPRSESPRRSAHMHSLPPLLGTIPIEYIALLREAKRKTYFPPQLEMYLSDLCTAIRHWHELDGTLITARARKDAEEMARAWRVLGMDMSGMELIVGVVDSSSSSESSSSNSSSETSEWTGVKIDTKSIKSASVQQEGVDVPVLSVTEVDVGRTVPRVVSHRVRVRERCEEVLASVLFRAGEGGEGGRRTVKEVLVQILGEV